MGRIEQQLKVKYFILARLPLKHVGQHTMGRASSTVPHLFCSSSYKWQAKSVCRPSSRLIISLLNVRPAKTADTGRQPPAAMQTSACLTTVCVPGHRAAGHAAHSTPARPPGMSWRFFSQKMEQKEPEKWMPSTHA